MNEIVLIQSSLNPKSKTAIVLNEVKKKLEEKGAKTFLLDLRDYEIPFCDGRKFEEYPSHLQDIKSILDNAHAFVIGFPVYLYTFSGVLKNFLDIFSSAFHQKVCAIVANAGGSNSYLASRDLMNAMSFEEGTLFIQPTVYTYSKHFSEGKITDEYVFKKIDQMIERLIKVSNYKLPVPAEH